MLTPPNGKKEPMLPAKVILSCAVLVMTLGITHAQATDIASGRETFLKYCASCHGEDGKGNGLAANAFRI